ncbi:MAG: ParB/RepB/Spo0J family partition protein [Pseudomonadota bacterium]
MVKKSDRKGLGRGLSALLVDAQDPAPGVARPKPESVLPIERIRPNPDQPRRHFAEDDLADLSKSIREKGILQPLIVRVDPNDGTLYQIVAGERRWRAAQRAQVHQVPVLVRDLTDEEVLELAIIENIQRADLNAIEEAAGYRQLMDSFGHTQERLAESLGKSRSHIANLLRLLTLPDSVQALLISKSLSAGHARALITAEDPVALAQEVVVKGLSVRQTEVLARGKLAPAKAHPRPQKDADTRALEADLGAALGLKVGIDHRSDGGGEMRLKYKTLEELDALCQKLSQ